MRVREAVVTRGKPEADSLPGRTWRAIPEDVRTVLVMLCSDREGGATHLAKQPWESFNERERASMAASARHFSRGLRDAAALW